MPTFAVLLLVLQDLLLNAPWARHALLTLRVLHLQIRSSVEFHLMKHQQSVQLLVLENQMTNVLMDKNVLDSPLVQEWSRTPFTVELIGRMRHHAPIRVQQESLANVLTD
jgi:hypothetical protein